MSDRPEILIIEDDPVLGPSLMQRLRLEGFAPRLAPSGQTAVKELRRNPPRAIVSDIQLPDMNGEDIFRQMLDINGLLPVFFVTAFGEVDQAVRLIKAGARDYLTKPVDADVLVGMLQRVTQDGEQAVEKPGDPPASGTARPPGAIAVDGKGDRSPAMRQAAATLQKFARTDLPVLLRGETGVGKEVAARRLHEMARPAGSPFVAVNCAAMPNDLLESTLFGHEKGAFTGATTRKPGLAEEAGDGSLFLDEIGELPLELQAKLLRLLQEATFLPLGATAEQRFRGRIIAATHADLEARIGEGLFREDLLFRINVLELELPPLRERLEDLPDLAEMLLAQANERVHGTAKRLHPEAVSMLSTYHWPGNVRELRNRIERAVVMAEGEAILPEDLFPDRKMPARAASERATPETTGQPASLPEGLQDTARDAIRRRVQEALQQTNGNQSEAARLLGVSRTTVWKYAQ
jgi:DNA-binding NtrC family response regulator